MAGRVVETMLTTKDNPFNPFTHYAEWYAWDVNAGYHTCAYLARIVRTSDEISEADQNVAIDDAMDEIVRENLSGVHVKVSKSSE